MLENRDRFQHQGGLAAEFLILMLLFLKLLLTGLELIFLVLKLMGAAVCLSKLLVQGAFFLADAVFCIFYAGIALIYSFFMLAAQGEEFLLGLKDALVLDGPEGQGG